MKLYSAKKQRVDGGRGGGKVQLRRYQEQVSIDNKKQVVPELVQLLMLKCAVDFTFENDLRPLNWS